MHVLDIILVLIIGVPILILCIPILFGARKERGSLRVIMALGAMFLGIGAVGFFGSALASLGGLKRLGADFEWPIGFASGVITTKDSIHIVPHTPSGRIQLYDLNWKFLRGWQVDASGGTFKLVGAASNQVEVVTARGRWHYEFDLNGHVLSKSTYAPASYSDFPESQEAHWLPLAPWLWVFSHPFLSWTSFIIGIVLVGTHDRLKKKAKRKKSSGNTTNPSASSP
jgi:hypothetical protein